MREENCQKLYILYEKESLLSPLTIDIVWSTTQLFCQIFK